jgi:hypothetical protein
MSEGLSEEASVPTAADKRRSGRLINMGAAKPAERRKTMKDFDSVLQELSGPTFRRVLKVWDMMADLYKSDKAAYYIISNVFRNVALDGLDLSPEDRIDILLCVLSSIKNDEECRREAAGVITDVILEGAALSGT